MTKLRVRRGRSVEAESGVALLEHPGPHELTEVAGERSAAGVFGDHPGVRGEEAGGICGYAVERGDVLRGRIVGRVEKDDVESRLRGGEVLERALHRTGFQAEVAGDAERGEIGANRCDRRWCLLDEGAVPSAAAECLKTDGAGSGIKISKAGTLDARREHVEEGLAQAIAGGSGGRPAWGDQLSRPIGTRYDPHASLRVNAGRGRRVCPMGEPRVTAAPTIRDVLQMAFPLGRWFGVHLRMHLSFLLVLALAAGYSSVATGSMLRGVGLWLALCAAVAVREIARAVAAAYTGVPLHALFLLPFGGVMAMEPRPGGLPKRSARIISWTGAAANFLAALFLLGFSYGVDPSVSLLRQPWITIEHILRSAVWMQVAVGLVNLLPAKALSSQRLLRPTRPKTTAPEEDMGADGLRKSQQPGGIPMPGLRRPAFGLGTALALALIVSGFVLSMLWPVLLGLTLLFMNYVGRLAAVTAGDSANLTVGDVMLTEYTPLSASNTLLDALRRTTHTAQDTFPVVRGDRLVGWVSRATLATRLQADGNSYLQGAMSRSLQTASPSEKLGDALRRAAALGANEFVPVVEDGAMVGLLTPSSLERAVGQHRLTQSPPERERNET